MPRKSVKNTKKLQQRGGTIYNFKKQPLTGGVENFIKVCFVDKDKLLYGEQLQLGSETKEEKINKFMKRYGKTQELQDTLDIFGIAKQPIPADHIQFPFTFLWQSVSAFKKKNYSDKLCKALNQKGVPVSAYAIVQPVLKSEFILVSKEMCNKKKFDSSQSGGSTVPVYEAIDGDSDDSPTPPPDAQPRPVPSAFAAPPLPYRPRTLAPLPPLSEWGSSGKAGNEDNLTKDPSKVSPTHYSERLKHVQDLIDEKLRKVSPIYLLLNLKTEGFGEQPIELGKHKRDLMNFDKTLTQIETTFNIVIKGDKGGSLFLEISQKTSQEKENPAYNSVVSTSKNDTHNRETGTPAHVTEELGVSDGSTGIEYHLAAQEKNSVEYQIAASSPEPKKVTCDALKVLPNNLEEMLQDQANDTNQKQLKQLFLKHPSLQDPTKEQVVEAIAESSISEKDTSELTVKSLMSLPTNLLDYFVNETTDSKQLAIVLNMACVVFSAYNMNFGEQTEGNTNMILLNNNTIIASVVRVKKKKLLVLFLRKNGGRMPMPTPPDSPTIISQTNKRERMPIPIPTPPHSPGNFANSTIIGSPSAAEKGVQRGSFGKSVVVGSPSAAEKGVQQGSEAKSVVVGNPLRAERATHGNALAVGGGRRTKRRKLRATRKKNRRQKSMRKKSKRGRKTRRK